MNRLLYGICVMFVPNHGVMSINRSSSQGSGSWMRIMRVRSHGRPWLQSGDDARTL